MTPDKPHHRVYSFRVEKMKPAHYSRLHALLETERQLYNAALEQRRAVSRYWRIAKKLYVDVDTLSDTDRDTLSVAEPVICDYVKNNGFVDWFAQKRWLTHDYLPRHPEMRKTNRRVHDGTLKRLDVSWVRYVKCLALQCKCPCRHMCGDKENPCKHKAGEPHFVRAGKFRTLELDGIEASWLKPGNGNVVYDLDRKIIWLAIKGLPKLRLHTGKRAAPPKEDLKSIKISVQGRRVYAHLGYAVDIPAAPRTGVDAGIDLGVTDTLATSEGRRIGANKAIITDGELIKVDEGYPNRHRSFKECTPDCEKDNRGICKKHTPDAIYQRERKRLQRKIQRQKDEALDAKPPRGQYVTINGRRRFRWIGQASRSHKRTLTELNRLERKRAHAKRQQSHRISSDLAARYDMIVFEDLQIKNMTAAAKGKGAAQKRGLNREINRQGWGDIKTQTEYKASAGKDKTDAGVKEAPPQYTSQRCSGCGAVSPGARKGKRYDCPECGLTKDADFNASANVLLRGYADIGVTSAGSNASPGARQNVYQIGLPI